MGSWGVGMLSNDAALDALSYVKGAKDAKDALRLMKPKLHPKGEPFDSGDVDEILGVAEHFLDARRSVKGMRSLVDQAVVFALTEDELSRWRDPAERKDALLRFKARLDGKKVDRAALARDREGLLTKMARVLGEGKP